MTIIERILSESHKILAKSRVITILAIKLRNQCNLIITQRFAIKNMSPQVNGEHLLLNHLIFSCNTYFDIGANKGEWTAYILENQKNIPPKLYLYEPGVAAYNISVERFKDVPNVEIFDKALSDSVGKLEFYEQANAGELSSAIKSWAYGIATSIEVETTTVDSEITRLNINYIDYAKIDTEGFDLKILKGATNAIKHKKIGFIQFEYNRVWQMSGSSLLEAYEILEDCEYKIYLLKPDGLYTYDVRKYGEFYAFSNFLAVAPRNFQLITAIVKGAA
jgi:FkbM family methyltransferase